ncbi:MAG: DUF1667 domain-containing protein [Bullifex sp.]
MKVTELTCINCPLGCQLTASVENGKVISVTGNTCLRGVKYAETEVVSPKRTVTSTIKAGHGRISVKTVPEVPKDMVFRVMDEIHSLNATPPVRIGDVIIHDIASTGCDLVATSEMS